MIDWIVTQTLNIYVGAPKGGRMFNMDDHKKIQNRSNLEDKIEKL